jgi:hypothetical protein
LDAKISHLSDFAPFGSIEEDPDRQVVGELLEAMHDPRGDEQDVPPPEAVPFRAVDEEALAPDHDIDLVARMRLLGIVTSGCIELDRERPVLKRHDEATALGCRQPLQPFVRDAVEAILRANVIHGRVLYGVDESVVP